MLNTDDANHQKGSGIKMHDIINFKLIPHMATALQGQPNTRLFHAPQCPEFTVNGEINKEQSRAGLWLKASF